MRDLGVIFSNDGTFDKHIELTLNKMKSMSSWILRTFQTRDSVTLLTLWKSLVMPLHDYCSQLWSPTLIKYKAQFEQLQYQFLRKISGMRGLSYSDILMKFKMYSLERRRDRYRVIYAWKQLESLVPNTGLQSNCTERRGRMLVVPPIPQRSIGTVTYNRYVIKLWNELPWSIRNCTGVSVNKFKSHLDKYLPTVEDFPHLPNPVTRRCVNDLCSMIKVGRQDARMMGRVPLSTKQ